ncbi:hypothetical protein [Pseudosporangium ferrugineum]|uniref:hypothetical protein n=1 Tax=Pseudosporangium ferrugineum TaxID=439699 RepID=UPI001FE75BF5|nr:hypothetical protein [Pseudosporangium ferrugineum]
MRRSLTAALAALTTVAAVAGPAGPATATHRGEPVTGTYAAGSPSWRSLPTTYAGSDAGAPTDATVVVDPSQVRQRYAGIGFSIDETSVSNLWKLTPPSARRPSACSSTRAPGPASTGSGSPSAAPT